MLDNTPIDDRPEKARLDLLDLTTRNRVLAAA